MPFALGQRSLTRSAHVDPKLMAVVALAIAGSPVDFGMTEDQSRTAEEQLKKFNDGVSKIRPGPAARHMIQPDGYSKAVDLVPWIDGKFQWGDGQWRVTTQAGLVMRPFFDIAAAMQAAAIKLHTPIRWGAIWDRVLNDLNPGAHALALQMEDYKARHPGPDFLDGPHFELIS